MSNSMFPVDVLVNDKPIRQFAHNGKVFVESRNGVEYSIKLRNNNHSRILAIVSVDGINVIDGEVATPDGAGYIVDGYSCYTIKGFRTSNDKVNAFKFSQKDRSYAAKNEATGGDTANCGVIGIQLFYEQINWNVTWSTAPIWGSSPPVWTTTAPNFLAGQSLSNNNLLRCCHSAEVSNFDMGTEFSQKQVTDKVQTVEFKRGHSAGLVEIYYASRPALESMGVKIDKTASVAFPQAFQPSQFCKPPKW
jgi:hypothetical protein